MNRLITLGAVLAGILLGSPQSRAADPEFSPDAKSPFNLSFKGGKPADLLNAISAVSGSRPNALIQPELADVSIPPMELRSVTVPAVFESLNQLSRNSYLWFRESAGSSGGSSPVWILQRPTDSRQARAFYIGHLLKKFKIDDITTAVRSTWELSGKEPKTELKYHQDTKLLLALGRPDQLNAMTEVLEQLKLAVEPEATPSTPRKNP